MYLNTWIHARIIIYLNLYTHAYNVCNYIYWVVEVDDEIYFFNGCYRY